MKILLMMVGLMFISVAALLIRPIIKHPPEIQFDEWLHGAVGISFLLGGLKIIWASFSMR